MKKSKLQGYKLDLKLPFSQYAHLSKVDLDAWSVLVGMMGIHMDFLVFVIATVMALSQIVAIALDNVRMA